MGGLLGLLHQRQQFLFLTEEHPLPQVAHVHHEHHLMGLALLPCRLIQRGQHSRLGTEADIGVAHHLLALRQHGQTQKDLLLGGFGVIYQIFHPGVG